MKNILSKISGKTIMWLCIAACALPFVFVLALGGQVSLIWLALLGCVGMHMVMMKLMPGHKSCHGDESSSMPKNSQDNPGLPNKPSIDMEA